jgi:hypothetical protein
VDWRKKLIKKRVLAKQSQNFGQLNKEIKLKKHYLFLYKKNER